MLRIKNFIINQIKNAAYICLPEVCKVIARIPKDKNLWVFGAWKGKLYADNSKYLFEYINEKHPEIHAVWISRDRQVTKSVIEKGYKACYRYSLKGMYLCVCAGVSVMTEDTHDISKVLIAGSKMIQLWHGMGIKDVKRFTPKDISKARAHYLEYTHPYERQYWMTACQDAIEKYSDTFGVPKDRMFITGQPKDDNFVDVPRNTFVDELRKAHPG